MKRIIFILMALVALAGISFAADGFQKITVSNTSIGFTAVDALTTYNKAVCSVETDAIRILPVASKTPEATIGLYVASGSTINLTGSDIVNFKAIRVTNDATINCLFWK